MKTGQDFFNNKASFLSIDKNLQAIVNRLLKNDNLCKLLYYTQKDCLKAPDLTMEQKLTMLNRQIQIVPKLDIVNECPNFIIITFDKFIPNATNPEFNDFTITIDVLCHPDHWNMGNFALRPYKIAGEIDSMLNNKKIIGIGTMTFLGGANLALNDQLMGLTLAYMAIHGIEDKINPIA